MSHSLQCGGCGSRFKSPPMVAGETCQNRFNGEQCPGRLGFHTPPEDIDAAIAREVMGWTEHECRDGHQKTVAWRTSWGSIAYYAWRPSRDIADAFRVIDRMKALGFCYSLGTGDERGEHGVEFEGKGVRALLHSDNAPSAISRAALQAIRGTRAARLGAERP